MTTLPTANLPGGIDDAGPPVLICTGCGDAHGLLVEAIEAAVPVVPGLVSIEYSCSACGSFYGHDASVQQVAELLNAGVTAPGVLHFGRHFIHCSEPMEEVGEGISRLDPPAPRLDAGIDVAHGGGRLTAVRWLGNAANIMYRSHDQ